MTPDRWAHIQNLFNQALTHPPTERTAFLNAACGTDADLRSEVDSLLAENDTPHAVFQEEEGRVRAVLDDVSSTAMPRQIGPYRLIEPIGRGGMGTVYRAKRTDGGFTQQVAVKVIRRGMDTEDILHRFRMERQILASLNHPHIARLLDGGATPDGRPYFVMEHVDGPTLTAYCHDNKLSIPARLRLFETVCHAVHYAHQNLIVHRDLKPGNILVSSDGSPRLLDFGIAKLLDPKAAPISAIETHTERRILTPEYASPEQVRGEPITTASDVYALGVLLYELLTGRRPYQFPSRTPEALHRIICETDPARPSTALKSAEGFRTSMEQVQRQLRGDLDNIVAMAMRKEPHRRYASAEQLAADIKRHLNGLPVEAHTDSVGYRTRKFVRRHWMGVSMATVVTLLVTGFAVVTAVQQAETARARDRAEVAAQKATVVKDFMVDLFDASNPQKGVVADSVTARDLLDQGLDRIEALEDQPDVQAALMEAIGGAYHTLGYWSEARPLLQRAIAIHRQIDAPPNDLTNSLLLLADLERDQANFETAEPLLREALDLSISTLGETHDQVATVHNDLGLVLLKQGRIDEALPKYQRAIAIRRTLYGNEPNANLAANLHNLAGLMADQGRLDEAKALEMEALEMVQAVMGPDHLYVAYSLNDLSTFYGHQEDLGTVDSLLEQARHIAEKQLGRMHKFTAMIYYNQAQARRRAGRLKGAQALYRTALEIRQALLPPDHPDVSYSLAGMGMWHLDQNQPAEAEPYLQEAYSIRKNIYPEGHWVIALSHCNLGKLRTQQTRYPEAEAHLLRCYTDLEAAHGKEARYTQNAARQLAELYIAWDRPEEAALYQ